MPSLFELRITGLRTMNQYNVNESLFDVFRDALALTMDCYASPVLLGLPHPRFRATFQILNPRIDTVISNEFYEDDLKWGSYF